MLKALRHYRFPLILITCILIGAQLGLYIGQDDAGDQFLKTKIKPIGDIFLNLLFTIVVPLVFASIASAVANMKRMERLSRVLSVMLLIFIITGIISTLLMIAATNIFPPASGLNVALTLPPATEPLDPIQQIVKALTVNDFVDLFSKKNMLPLILFAVAIGFATNRLGEKARPFADLLNALNEIMMKLIDYVMYLAPIGLMAYFAYLTGTFGSDLLAALGRSVLLYFPMAAMYLVLFFSLYAWWAGGIKGVRAFWSNIIPTSLVAIGTGSSMAAIPSNIAAATRIGVPRDISELVIPIGATIHMDGSCMSAISKIAVLFGLYGQDFSSPTAILTALGVSLLSGTVMSGIPGGGKIGELLIISLYGFPPESLLIITALGDLVDAPATAVNSVGDNVASMMTARVVEGKDWMEKGV